MEEQASTPLSISTRRRDGTIHLDVAGELEFATAAPLRTSLQDLAQENVHAIVLDLGGVAFVDSTGISLLLQAKQRFEAQGCSFALRNLRPPVRRVFEIAGLDSLLRDQEPGAEQPR